MPDYPTWKLHSERTDDRDAVHPITSQSSIEMFVNLLLR